MITADVVRASRMHQTEPSIANGRGAELDDVGSQDCDAVAQDACTAESSKTSGRHHPARVQKLGPTEEVHCLTQMLTRTPA